MLLKGELKCKNIRKIWECPLVDIRNYDLKLAWINLKDLNRMSLSKLGTISLKCLNKKVTSLGTSWIHRPRLASRLGGFTIYLLSLWPGSFINMNSTHTQWELVNFSLRFNTDGENWGSYFISKWRMSFPHGIHTPPVGDLS